MLLVASIISTKRDRHTYHEIRKENTMQYLTKKNIPQQLLSIIKSEFNYTGTKFRCSSWNDNQPISVSSYWDGGSRDYAVLVNRDNYQVSRLKEPTVPSIEGSIPQFCIPQNHVLLINSISRGKNIGIYIYFRESEGELNLAGEKIELDVFQQIVLLASYQLQASYRLDNINSALLRNNVRTWSKDRYNAIRRSLVEKELMNKNFSLNADGKNQALLLEKEHYDCESVIADYIAKKRAEKQIEEENKRIEEEVAKLKESREVKENQAAKFRNHLINETRQVSATVAVKLLANNDFQEVLDKLESDSPNYVWDFESQLTLFLAASEIIKDFTDLDAAIKKDEMQPTVITKSLNLFGQQTLLTIRFNDCNDSSIIMAIGKNRGTEFTTVCSIKEQIDHAWNITDYDGLGEILCKL